MSGWRGALAVAGGAGALRLCLALGLWALAAWAGQKPPLEVLAFRLELLDAMGYHAEAREVLRAWADARAGRGGFEAMTFSVVLAGLYRLLGMHPLWGALLAVLGYAAVGLFAYGLARELGRGRRAGLALAAAAALWPPSLPLSVLPLKEGPALAAVLGVLYCLLRLLRAGPGWRSWAGWLCGLAAAAGAMAFLRYYLWQVAWALVPAVVLLRLWPGGRRPGWGRVLAAAAGLAAALLVVAPLARETIPYGPGTRADAPPAAPREPKAPTRPPAKKGQRFAGFHDRMLHEGHHTPDPGPAERLLRKLSSMRRKSAMHGGGTLSPEAREGPRAVALEGRFDTPGQALATTAELAGAALRDLFLWPFPWRPFPAGPWGPVKAAVAAWAALWWLALPGLAAGAAIHLRRRPVAAGAVLAWSLVLGLLLGVVVLNRGTLFRLRDLSLIPLVLLWHPWPYLAAARLLVRRRRPL